MATTLFSLATVALTDIGVLGAGQTMNAAQGQDALTRANRMLKAWSVQPLTIPVIKRHVFDTVVGKGSPDNPYTVGTGGDLDMKRPNLLRAAAELQNADTANEVEIPRAILTWDAYAYVQVKRITQSLITSFYYRPDFEDGFGRLFVWPIPSDTTYKIVLYADDQLDEFAGLHVALDLPPAAEEAIQYGLAERLLPSYAVPSEVKQDIKALARSSLAVFKRSNTKLVDLPTDPALTTNRRYGYNIVTGTGG